VSGERSGRRRLRSVPLAPQQGPELPVETELQAPGVRAEWVERPGLAGYLAGLTARLILVSAPLGYGKTTLVAQWRASEADRRFAWITLGSADNDPRTLWWQIVQALQRACPELDGGQVLQVLRAPVPDIGGAAIPVLVSELGELTAPVVLVLDSYDHINEASCHDQIALLLLQLPSSAQVVLATRTAPPLPLPRLRAAGNMAEIGARELRLTAAEAALLVRAASGVELSKPDAGVLTERTEGWAAGLYLAALSLRGHPSPASFVRQFTGHDRFIADLLTEEVLSRQPAEIRQFLVRTAVLDRFCAPLCDAVTGSGHAAKIIDALSRDNAFIVPLDETGRWFRYHHLFAQLLRGQLAAVEPDLVPALHARASAWHRQAGSADEAIRHALAAGDVAAAIDLVGQHWSSYVDSGRVATVRGWMRSLGDNQIAANPVAAHYAAWAAAVVGDQDPVQRWLAVIEEGRHDGPLPDGIRSLESSAALLRATFGFAGIRDMRAAAATAVTLESSPASPWHATARAVFGAALYFSGELEPAAAQAREALAGKPSHALARMLARTVLALVAVEQGSLDRAEELALLARGIAADPDLGLAGGPQSSIPYAATGAVYAARGRLREARAELERGLRMRRRWFGVSPWYTLEILLRLAAVLLELGDRRGAATLLDEAGEVLTALPDGAQAQLARLDRLQRRLDSRRAQATAAVLTERELAVLRLLPGHLSLRQIGQQLSLSQNTIKTHVRAIYRKLGVSARSDAIQQARRTGLL
jgi:ATP/maltotriose-dependent transcriptional regulator MalT